MTNSGIRRCADIFSRMRGGVPRRGIRSARNACRAVPEAVYTQGAFRINLFRSPNILNRPPYDCAGPHVSTPPFGVASAVAKSPFVSSDPGSPSRTGRVCSNGGSYGRIVRAVSKCVKLHLRGRDPECDGGGGDKHHCRQSHVPHPSFESDQLYIDPTELSTSRLFFRLLRLRIFLGRVLINRT